MKDIYKNWDFDRFLKFIMYHAAHADYYFAQEEKELILRTLDIQDFYELRDFYEENSDYENIQVILYFKEKFGKDKDSLAKVYEAVNLTFNIDGNYSFYEKNMLKGLKLLLG